MSRILFYLWLWAFGGVQTSAVVDLTEYTAEEFSLELQNHAAIFVKFYTPTCPHCKSMAQDFNLVARQLQEEDEVSIVLAELDCSHDAGEEVCTKYGVAAFPTLKLFRYGSFYKNYNSQRNAKTMKKWLMNQVQGSSQLLQSVSELNEVIRSSDEVTVAAVVKSGQMKLLTHFLKASKKVKQHPMFAALNFYHVISDEMQNVWASFSKDQSIDCHVSLHRPRWLQSVLQTDRASITLTLKRNITEWVFNQTYGLIGFRTPQTDRNIHDPRSTGPLVAVFYAFDFRNATNATHYWRDQLIPFVDQYHMLTFTISKSSDYGFYLKTKSLAVPDPLDPPVVMFYDSLTIPYAMDGQFTANNLHQFLDTVMRSNELMPRLRSNSSCPDNVNWTLPCMAGSDFKRNVALNPKEVVIIAYKQANGETLKLVMKVAQYMASGGSQVVDAFTLDTSLNEAPHAFDSNDYPVIFYVSASKKVLRIDRKFTEVLITEMVREYKKKHQVKNTHQTKTEL